MCRPLGAVPQRREEYTHGEALYLIPIAAKDPRAQAIQWNDEGNTLLSQGDFAAAIDRYERVPRPSCTRPADTS